MTASPDLAGQAWHAFVRTLAIAAAAAFAALLSFLLAVDPYDTGRTGIFARRGLPDQFVSTANASRGSDPRFDAAIIGNSHVQMLQPARLASLTGDRFVSLAIPGSHPDNHEDLLRWFVANHRAPTAIVIGVDQLYCGPTRVGPARFPAWLYADSFPEYLVGLVRYRSLEAAFARLAFLWNGRRPLRPDGFADYSPVYDQIGLGAYEASRKRVAEPRAYGVNLDGPMPGIERLGRALLAVPAPTAVILLRPPMYRTALPIVGSDDERTSRRCAAALAAVAASRPRTRFLDLLDFGAYSADPDNFFDHDHFREPVAEALDRQVADAIRDLQRPSAASR